MNYDEFYHTFSFIPIDTTLLKKSIHGYTSIIVFKINSEILCLTPIWNASWNKPKNSFHQKNYGNQELLYLCQYKQCILYQLIIACYV